jgi:predicted Zn-dependent protease
LIDIVAEELDRIDSVLQQQPVPPHWMAIEVVDIHRFSVEAANGATTKPHQGHERIADIDIRVGTPQLDNTHKIRDAGWFDSDDRVLLALPLTEDSEPAIKQAMWRAFDDGYRAAVKRLMKVQANQSVKVAQQDLSDDFSESPTSTAIENIPQFKIDAEQWRNQLRTSSARLAGIEHVEDSNIGIMATLRIRTIVTTEGTKIQIPSTLFRISAWAKTTASDGMELSISEYVDARSEEGLPTEVEFDKLIDSLVNRLADLQTAPVVEPATAPAILQGRAAAVFFHEVLGHRVEGHRQKDEDEGQTFTDKIGESVLPAFISVYDDPTLTSIDGVDLNGSYTHDNEGVKAQRVTIVDRGILRNFLTSRSPIKGFPHSNGHGRREPGNAVVSRQGNLIIEAHHQLSSAALRTRLLKEIRRQNKDYGFIVDDITGGFTFTGRVTPNAFAVQPVTVWRVWADGRPDDLVRGVDLIGTPLTTFKQILAASNEREVFNGSCGAESGWVPVSATAPSLLIGEIEVQRSEKEHDRPPLLPPPQVQK